MPPLSPTSSSTLRLSLTEALARDPRLRQAFLDQLHARHRRDLADAARARHAASLLSFVQDAWPVLEPVRPLVIGWALKALCQHLEAISRGELTLLLINVPPGMMKSLLLNVFWPAWEWGPRDRAELRYLAVAYKQDHAGRDGRKMRQLVESDWYQGLYGERVQLVTHAVEQFENSRSGFRKSRSISSVTGERADRVLIDDPHNLAEAESDAERASVVQNFRENVLNRVNDPAHSAIVVIMQRVHEKDVSGEILRGGFGFEHLCLPMRFDSARRCHTRIGFRDPRSWEGEILFPQLANVTAADRLEAAMGAYAFAAQYQQAPVSREGNWFKRAFFSLVDGPPPKILRRVMAWDLASTEKMGSNDPDWTVGLLGGVDEAGDIWILELFRFRKSPGARNTFIEEIVRGYGYEVLQLFPLDPGQAGKDQEHNLKKLLERHGQLKFTPPRGDKRKRVMDSGALVNAELGRIRLGAFTERPAFLDEVCAFPAGRHDDIVDALSDLVRELRSGDEYDLAAVGSLGQLLSGLPTVF